MSCYSYYFLNSYDFLRIIMEMLKDFLSNFLKSQEEKIKLPTFVTFLIAFLVFKIWIYWKPISIFLLSKEDIETRIIKIDNQINLIEKNFSISSWWQSILFSIFITTIYTILFPYIQLKVNYIISSFKKKNFNIQAEFESECGKIKLKREIEEREYRNLQNQNTTDRSFADQLRDRDDELRNLLAEMGRLSKNYNNRIEEMNKLHSDEIGSIHSDYQKKIENLNKEIAELQDRIEYISYQAQQVENDMRQEREKEFHLYREQENLEYNRLSEENEKLRWELEQLRSKDSS
ncbi:MULTISPECIES: hypothetical protein [Neisseria]|uniref:hypothetical protein n=1 Tax=Neisseria TaxID=482 RepID=UPI000A4503A3|nr:MULTISPECIES: hypothetical protein [Neisseria]